MDGVGGMEEEGRGAGGVERGDNLHGDIGAFANTGDDNTSRGRKQCLDGLRKAVVNIVLEIFYCFFLVVNYLNSNLFYLFWAFHSEFFFTNSFFLTIFVNHNAPLRKIL